MGFWTRVLHRSFSYICEYVRLFNHLNWTSRTQVMVPFPGLLQLRLFNSLWERIMAYFVVLFGAVYDLC